jgi:hypothetical protein
LRTFATKLPATSLLGQELVRLRFYGDTALKLDRRLFFSSLALSGTLAACSAGHSLPGGPNGLSPDVRMY